MNAEQPDYSKLPKQFQFGVEKGKTINLFDGKKQIAHLIDTVVLLNSRLIEEVEERTRLQRINQTYEEWADMSEWRNERIAELEKELAELKKRNQTCEECCAGWAKLSEEQIERIAELEKQLKEVIEDTQFELCEDCEIRQHQHQFPDHKYCEECDCCKGCDCCECDQLTED